MTATAASSSSLFVRQNGSTSEEPQDSVFGPNDYVAHFDPESYLEFYYSSDSMSQGTRVSLFVLPIFAQIISEIPEKERRTLVDVGAGPTIYSAICFRNVVSRIYITDFAERNLEFLESWLTKSKSFDWSGVMNVVLRNEGARPLCDDKINKILETCREKVNNGGIFHADVHHEKVIPFMKQKILFDILVSVFCLEAACTTFEQYKVAMKNMTSLIRPKGRLILGSVTEDTTYISGMSKASGEVTIFRLVHLTEEQIMESLGECDFDLTTMRKYALSNEGVLFLMVAKKGSAEDAFKKIPAP